MSQFKATAGRDKQEGRRGREARRKNGGGKETCFLLRKWEYEILIFDRRGEPNGGPKRRLTGVD